jgi:DNA polymerase-3 subunit delta'
MNPVEEPDRQPGAPHPRETAVLFGQDRAQAAFLKAATSGRLHHAWAITGPRGIGKATLAWRIGRWLVAGGEGASLAMTADNPVFGQVAALGSPQVFLARRPWDEMGERLRSAITVEEVRAMKAFFQLTAADGGWRVSIVDSADELNGAAANALLKILEEPPPRAMLLLVCHRPSGLLPTIRSRCRSLRCQPLSSEALAASLTALGTPPPPERAAALAILADGSVAAALGLVVGDGLTRYGEIVELLGGSMPLDRGRIIALADAAAGRDAADRYGLILDLTHRALGRLALAASGGAVEPISDAEAALFARLGATPPQGRLWAALLSDLVGRAAHARAVNLDPAQVILDSFLQIDAAAAEARAHAA